MPFLEIDSENKIYYEYVPPDPGAERPLTFVFCNSMGLTIEKFWSRNLAPDVRARGFGTLIFDWRGQGQSIHGPAATLEPEEIIADIVRVVNAVAPENPVLVGIAIGGLYAAEAIVAGVKARGLVMSNSIRTAGTHTEWMIELERRLLELGGMRLANDVLSPTGMSPAWLARQRPTHLQPDPYEPLPPTDRRVRIQAGMKKYRFDLPYERLDLPVLVITGAHNRRCFPDEIAAMVARMPQGKSVIFAEAGLGPHKDSQPEFIDTICAFAAQL
jgi:3-oxoadipate enol-lactonase